METKRATILIESDDPAEVTGIEAWFAKWGDKLTYKSANQGCGCCVHIWDVEAPIEVIESLPKAFLSASDWTRTSPTKP